MTTRKRKPSPHKEERDGGMVKKAGLGVDLIPSPPEEKPHPKK